MTPPRVAITQPVVPGYRVPLFESLIDRLGSRGIEARVFYGGPALRASQARDEVVHPPWATRVVTRAVELPFGAVYFRRLPAGWRRGTVLLTELAAGNLNAWWQIPRREPYVLLGHGKSYVTAEGKVSKELETVLGRRARHVLTYTKSGEEAVLERTGLPAGRVSTFYNATDSTALANACAAATPADVADFRRTYGIPDDARCGVYIGALETYKKVSLLAGAARIAFAEDPRVHLVVAGSGPSDGELRALAAATGRVTMLGHTGREGLAVLAHVAEVLLVPGRVGLVAVDALAMGLPVLTTSSTRHAPEIEYLHEGESLFTVEDDPLAYARRWVEGFGTPPPPRWLPGIEDAVDRISAALFDVVDEFARR